MTGLIAAIGGGLVAQMLMFSPVQDVTLPRLHCASPVVVQSPAADLASQVANKPDGTCFYFEDGTYRFHDVVPKDRMSFIGASTVGVVVDGTGYENAFHGTADDVTIGNMTFRNFDNSAGTSRQEQAPIRGTAALWASNRGQMASGWVVTDVVSHDNYASGIFLGDNWTVKNSEFYANGVTGIGGDDLVGGLIEDNIIHQNGTLGAQGVLTNGAGLKLTQSGTAQKPVVVRGNEFYENTNTAVWCDLGCDGFQVVDNSIHDHRSFGIVYELSSNAIISGNEIINSNTWTDFNTDFNGAAVAIAESRDALVENNLIAGARAALIVRQTSRPAPGETFLSNYPYVNYVSSHVIVRHNTIRDTAHIGISTGVSGRGLISQPETISFVGNTYESPNSMTFWWNNGDRLSFSAWQAAGRDVEAEAMMSTTTVPPATTPTTMVPATVAPPATTPTTVAPPATTPTTVVPTTVPAAAPAVSSTTRPIVGLAAASAASENFPGPVVAPGQPVVDRRTEAEVAPLAADAPVLAAPAELRSITIGPAGGDPGTETGGSGTPVTTDLPSGSPLASAIEPAPTERTSATNNEISEPDTDQTNAPMAQDLRNASTQRSYPESARSRNWLVGFGQEAAATAVGTLAIGGNYLYRVIALIRLRGLADPWWFWLGAKR